MQITQHTDYALRVLITLGACPERRVTIKEVAETFDISRSQTRIETLVDETETRRAAMTEAIVHRMAPHGQLPERAREFRHMSLLRMAEESLGAQGIRVRGMSPLEIASRALHSTSDFPYILANVMNTRLRAGYDENVPSYAAWARRAPNAPDFKTLSVVQHSCELGREFARSISKRVKIRRQCFGGAINYRCRIYGCDFEWRSVAADSPTD